MLREASEGKNPSFYVPFGRFRESLQAACPEIVEDVGAIMGGGVSTEEAEESIEGTAAFRRAVVGALGERGLRVPSVSRGEARPDPGDP